MKHFAFVLTVVILAACSRQEHSKSTDTKRAVAAVSTSAPALPQINSTPLSAASAVQPALEIRNAQVLTSSALTTTGALAISADGKTGAYINDHNEVIVWDALQLSQQESITSPEIKPTAVAVSPNGDRLAIGNFDSSIVIWSRSHKKVLLTLSGYKGRTTALAFSPDGKILASGTSDHTTQLWDLSSGKQLHEFVSRGGGMAVSGNIVSLEFSGDGGLLLAQEFYREQYEVGRNLTILDTKEGYEVSTKNVAPPNTDDHERSGMSVGGMGWMLAYTGQKGLITERLDDCGSTSHQFGTGGYADTIVTDWLGRWVATIEVYSLNFLDVSGKMEAQKITLPGKTIEMVAHPEGSSIFVLLNKEDSAGNISESGGMIYRIAVPKQMQTLPPMTAVTNKVRCKPSEKLASAPGTSQSAVASSGPPAFSPLATSATSAIDLQGELLGAIRNRGVAEVKALLDKGAEPNAKDKYQGQYDGDEDGHDRTPLHYAILYYGYDDSTAKIIKLLVSRGANVNAGDADGATPLHYALGALSAEGTEARNAVKKVVAALVSNGANVDARHPMTGETPLQMAVYNDYKSSVELLIAHGANVNARNKAGQTPLFYAMDKDIAELLLEHGAKVNIKTPDGDTPLSFAQSHNYSDLVKLLRAHGAKQ